MSAVASVVDWLLASGEPGIVFQAKRDLLSDPDPPEAGHVMEGPKVRALLARPLFALRVRRAAGILAP